MVDTESLYPKELRAIIAMFCWDCMGRGTAHADGIW